MRSKFVAHVEQCYKSVHHMVSDEYVSAHKMP